MINIDQYLKKNDVAAESVLIKCENERSKYFSDVYKGIYVLNPMMSESEPGQFQPIDMDNKLYIIRLNTDVFMKGGKKLNNSLRLCFIKARIWMNKMNYENEDAIYYEIKKSKIKGLKTKIIKKYKLYCPECLQNGRYNYTMTSNMKPRKLFCAFCDTFVLFKTKRKKIK